MIRQTLTTLFCALVFTMALMISPTSASHSIGAPYVCKTLEAAERTISYVEAGEFAELLKRAKEDMSFECYLLPQMLQFVGVLYVRDYMQGDEKKGLMLAKSPKGNDAYIFGPREFILSAVHQSGS